MVTLKSQGHLDKFTGKADSYGVKNRLRNKDVRQAVNKLLSAEKKKFVKTYESIGNGILQSKDWIKSKKKATAKATPKTKAQYIGERITELFSDEKIAEIETALGINFSTDV